MKERLVKQKIRIFFSQMLLKQQFNELTHSFPKLRALFLNFPKRSKETSFHSPPLVAPLNICRKLLNNNNFSVCGPSLVLYLFRPGNLASLGKRSIVTVFVHLAETMKQILISIGRYWWKRYVNDGN